ncbi:MAG: fused MFS/spermidine synthase [Acidobacteriaceae bacterium]|nr:fused MFS/spermidine synthase [Acidobacteriaceae bacterium]
MSIAVYAFAIFLSAFLLFAMEPVTAKKILPWFGGSAAVWSTCLVFYQTTLLAGYVYAQTLSRVRNRVLPFLVHGAVLALCLALLPIGPGPRWSPQSAEHPVLLILTLLTATIGLPFLALSATNPLLQHWLARGGHGALYRLFALSNFASLAALVLYPFVIEPWLGTRGQTKWWSVLFVCFVALCGCACWLSYQSTRDDTSFEMLPGRGASRPFAWFALAACGSMLLLSVTNHLDENVAAVPLLWVLPLSVYLLTFVFGFGSGIYRPSLWLRFLAFALGILGYSAYSINAIEAIQVTVPVFLAGLFLCCMFCHGELYRRRPDKGDLTTFYVMIAAGGAAGSMFIGLIAPEIFSAVYELPLTLVFTAVLALVLTWNSGEWPMRLLWVGATASMAAVCVANVRAYHEDAITLRRSFYGSLRVVQSPHAGPQQHRTLYHGTIQHGAQFLLPPGRSRPTTYYGPDSGIGIVLRECYDSPKRVGMVGLGVGTTAAYGRAGDTFRFYEINHQVIEIAKSLFFYLRETRAAVEIAEDDARISLARETVPPFDVLALDAFSGDAIPVHLLTREAFALYVTRVRPNGVIAFHVSNNYLDLAPVVAQLAEERAYQAVLVHNHANDDEFILPADWVIVTRNRAVLENSAIQLHSRPIARRTGLRPWSDDYNNLIQVFRTPQLK